jgi:hypothetical protein
MAMQTKAAGVRTASKAGRRAKSDSPLPINGRVAAAQAARGFVPEHEQVIQRLNGLRLIPALRRVSDSHRPRSGATVQYQFTDAADGEISVEVRTSNGTPSGALVLRAEFLEFAADEQGERRTRVCRVYAFERGQWVDDVLAEAAAACDRNKGRSMIRSDQKRPQPQPAA